MLPAYAIMKELQQICGDQPEYRDGYYYIVGVKGKGGKIRDVPVLPDYEATVVRCCVALWFRKGLAPCIESCGYSQLPGRLCLCLV